MIASIYLRVWDCLDNLYDLGSTFISVISLESPPFYLQAFEVRPCDFFLNIPGFY